MTPREWAARALAARHAALDPTDKERGWVHREAGRQEAAVAEVFEHAISEAVSEERDRAKDQLRRAVNDLGLLAAVMRDLALAAERAREEAYAHHSERHAELYALVTEHKQP